MFVCLTVFPFKLCYVSLIPLTWHNVVVSKLFYSSRVDDHPFIESFYLVHYRWKKLLIYGARRKSERHRYDLEGEKCFMHQKASSSDSGKRGLSGGNLVSQNS